MAADNNQRMLRKRKRKLEDYGIQPKLDVDQKVEVRSVEDGFLGSWHLATVIDCDDLIRRVRYDHLLSDKGSGNLVESVSLSPMLDEVILDDELKPGHYRGAIRPLPPPREFSRSPVPYGECVDYFYQDAWWEGVIFDHEENAEERRIFFPDMGDEMTVQVDKLRVTQDWDELTEEWAPRGSWIFLEVIEEIENGHPLLISVKQIWYEVQLKKDYENLGEWMSSSRDIWRNLVEEVVHDNTKLTIKHFFSELNSSPDFAEGGQLLEFSELTLDTKLNLDNSSEKQFVLKGFAPTTEDVQLSGNAVCNSIPPSQTEEEPDVQPRALSVVPPGTEEISGILSSAKSQPMTFTNFKRRRGRPPMKEKRLESQTSYEGKEIAPTTEDVQLSGNGVSKSIPPSQTEEEPDVMLHAFSVVPPCTEDISGILSSAKSQPMTLTNFKRRRGRPPTKGKRLKSKTAVNEPEISADTIAKYMPSISSVKKFKKHLLYLGWKFELVMDCNVIRKRYVAPDGKVCLSLNQVCEVLESVSKGSGPVSPVDERNLNEPPAKSSLSPCMEKPETCGEVPESQSNQVIIDPEICPKAIIEYDLLQSQDKKWKLKHGVKVRDISVKAKKHLAAIGWTFHYIGKIGRQLRFVSPEGQGFNSLRNACKWCVQKWKVEKSLPELMSSPSIGVESQNNSSPVKNSSEKLSKVKLCRLTKPRKKRKHGDEKDSYSGDVPVLKGKKSRPSLKKGDGIGPKLPSKRAREAALSSSSQKTPRTVLSWLIDNNVILPHDKVLYCEKQYSNPTVEGRITREGIECSCCHKIYGLRSFGAHAAGSSCHTPSANMFLEDGRSLLECQMQMKRKHRVINTIKKSCAVKKKKGGRVKKNKNDYICSVCHYGGKLLLCDKCPSSFHPACLGMKEVPDGDWFCSSCCCKVCGDDFDTNRNHFTDNSVLICSQCEHKYHARCSRSEGPGKLNNYPEGNWFCNKRCELIFLGMHNLLGKPVIVGADNLTWTLLKYIEPDDSGSDIMGYESSVENYSRLSVALNVMHECFEPVKEHHTKRDIVEDVIFSRWSDLNRLNFQGFYTVLLERNDELITVATVRVYGEKVAEIPLVATQFQHRRLGMCRILMNELEKKLVEFGVEKLVLPAVPAVLDTWTTSFGFSVVEEPEKINFLDYTFLDFQGTVLCQKTLQKTPEVSKEAQQTHFDNGNSEEDADLGGHTAVSEIFHAKQVEGCATVGQDQGSAE